MWPVPLLALMFLVIATAAHAQRVTDVRNGDTLVIDGVGEVRLLGIRSADESAMRLGRGTTPAPQPRRGPETPPTPVFSGAITLKPKRPARGFLQQLVLGKLVRLEYEAAEGDADRERAYVFLEETLVNAELLRRGLATVDDSRPFDRKEEFLEIQDDARTAGVGIWVEPR